MRYRLTSHVTGKKTTRRSFLSAVVATNLATIVPAYAWEDDERSVTTSSLVDSPRLIVGGGPDSLPGQVAPLVATALATGLNTPPPIAVHYDMGRDGVTAANLFDNVSPEADGGTAILAPGAALIASLSGDARVHFDFSRWAALIVARRPVVTLARAELHRTIRSRLSGLFHDRPVRVAVSHPTGVELSSLLGLSLLGLHPLPVAGYASKAEAMEALKSGQVDAVQLTPGPGDDLATDIATAPEGIKPIFYSGPAVANVPGFEATYLMARGHAPAGALFEAWRAVSSAAASALVLALPMLTPPLAIARWRHASQEAILDSALRSWNDTQHLTVVAGADAAPLLNQCMPELTSLLALRRWINNNQPRWRQGQETRPT